MAALTAKSRCHKRTTLSRQQMVIPASSMGIRLACVMVCWLLGACGWYAAVPLTLKEARDYVAGQSKSYSHPSRQVLAAAIMSLRQTGYTVRRVEFFNDRGWVEAVWKHTRVLFELDALTPRMTKLISKVRRRDSVREFSAENELFARIETILARGGVPGWAQLCDGMTPLHAAPNGTSPVIGYVGSGAEVALVGEEGNWGKVKLMHRTVGFIALDNL